MTETARETWDEEASRVYRDIAAVAVPRRAEQIAALLTLVPFGEDEAPRIVELACGEGLLGEALLEAFPRATYLGLDGSESMREHTAKRLARFGGRAGVGAFDIFAADWLARVDGTDVAVSSLCVHHLPDAGKRALFAALAPRLSPRGALLLADLVNPARPEALELFAETWNTTVAEQSRARIGSEALLARFLDEHWNHYRTPDPVDQPSRLFDQLLWMREAGLAVVDCYWMNAGHAVYGGYKAAGGKAGGRYPEALAIARKVLGIT
jgi:tRNA (cmo5U34)-methyltransferase